ncbi:MAG: GNAT family N-acetyltransferase [Candidatus Odinarchaeota archaeon]
MDPLESIETRRLILRTFNREDFEFFKKILNDDLILENSKYFFNPSELERPDLFFQAIIDSFKTLDPIIALLIIKKDTGDYIGSCGLKVLTKTYSAICFYSLLSSYRGFGFAIEAMKKLIEYGFLKLKLIKVSTFINPNNSSIWKVAERVGMKYLGHIQINNNPSKVMHFSIEKKEFYAQQFI